MESKVN